MLSRKAFLSSLWVASAARASLDPNNPPLFSYSQSFDLDLSSDFLDDPADYKQPLVVSSRSFLVNDDDEDSRDDGCCYVSSHALMSDSFLEWPHLDDLSSDDEDDDNNDDDDDGHSSMLSNASLKRSRVLVVGGEGSDCCYGKQQPHQPPSRAFYHRSSVPPADAFARSVPSNLLQLRGGASSSMGSEVAKKLLVTALVTLLYEGLIGHVLEFLKIAMQTADTTYAKVVSDITSEKGLVGLWDGFCPWGVIQALFKGAVFGLAHATASGFLLPLADQGKIPLPLALTLAGGIGGGFQGLVLSPTLLLKTRVMTNPVFREKMSLLRTTLLSFRIGADVVQSEGLLTLTKGANIFATKRVFDWATRFYFSDLFETLYSSQVKNGAPLTVGERSAASLLGGVASTCCTLPLDVLVAKTQDAKKAGVRVSAWKLFQDELREKGWSGLRESYMRGFEARLLHVCTTTMVIKTAVPIVYDAVYGVKS